MAEPSTKQKLQQRAKLALLPTTEKVRSRNEIIRIYKRFRKIEEARMRMAHRAGGGGLEMCETRSDFYDALLKHLWNELFDIEMHGEHRRLSISMIATGGYGRRHMNPYSDVDLMFLVPNELEHEITTYAPFITAFITSLWDIGLIVGDSSTRSIKEAYTLANQDNQVKTALIETRYIAGDETPYQNFIQGFDQQCMIGREDDFLKARQFDLNHRHLKQENTPFVQEPNIKQGCGGLRDYHNAVWTTYAKLGTRRLKELVKRDLISLNSFRDMERAYNFLLRVRNEMHYIEKREHDVLTLRLQGVVATNLGYKHKKILNRIEEFMRDYYQHTSNLLHRTSELMDRYHLQRLDSVKRNVVTRLLLHRRRNLQKFDGFIVKHERIYPEHDQIFKEDPPRLLRLFVHTQTRHLRLSPELSNLVQKSFELINNSFRYSRAARESFAAILQQPGDVGRTLRQMHRIGILGRYIPEFGALTCLVQHEFFHRYTADEHTLRTIDQLDELAGEPKPALARYQRIFQEIQEPSLLYLALLLHDSGRALNTNTHSDASATLAQRVCKRLQIKGSRLRLLMFLVDHHLTLFRTATSTNIEDPKVIAEFALIVRSKQYLNALLVMTLVDSKGTSDSSWNSWKESLILQLYHNTLHYLDDPSDFLSSATAPLEELELGLRDLLDPSYQNEITAHIQHMPRSYFNFRNPESIAQHIRCFREFFYKATQESSSQSLLPILKWEDRPGRGSTKLTVVCWDRSMLLARISGALAAMNINILSADLYRRSDDCILDVFRIAKADFTPVSSDWVKTRVKKLVEGSFTDESFDFSSAIAENRRRYKNYEAVVAEVPQRVRINNTLSADYTVIEVQALDRIGLLYDIFNTIGRLGCNICHARINTEKGMAVDSIYLQNQAEQKIQDNDLLERLTQNLNQLLVNSEL